MTPDAPPCMTCLQDVCDLVLPLAPSMTDGDVADLLLTIHANPTAGQDILDAYKVAAIELPPSTWDQVWGVLTRAAAIAGVMSNIGGAASTVVGAVGSL